MKISVGGIIEALNDARSLHVVPLYVMLVESTFTLSKFINQYLLVSVVALTSSPVNPASPGSPVGPTSPMGPTTPSVPGEPRSPWSPCKKWHTTTNRLNKTINNMADWNTKSYECGETHGETIKTMIQDSGDMRS